MWLACKQVSYTEILLRPVAMQRVGARWSRGLISRVTDALHEELAAWRNRPLELKRFTQVVFIDAIVMKTRDGVAANRPACVATTSKAEIFSLTSAADSRPTGGRSRVPRPPL